MKISKTAVCKIAAVLVLSLAVFRFGVAFAETPATQESQPSAGAAHGGTLRAPTDGRGFNQPHSGVEGEAHRALPDEGATRAPVIAAYGKLPLSFEANAGQTASDVKFLSRGNGYQLYLTPTEAVLTLSRGDAENAERPESVGARHDAPAPSQDAVPPSSTFVGARLAAPAPPPAVVKMKFLGAAKNPKISGESLLPGKVNYFIGKDKSKWRANVPTYGKVRYSSVYPGIDLVHYGTQDGQLEYDFVVAPGANPDRISLGISGGELMLDVDGSLVLNAPAPSVGARHDAPAPPKAPQAILRWGKPVIYQEIRGRRVPVDGGYKMKRPLMNGQQVVSFQIAAYDRSRPLIIDPLVYSTFLGGSGFDSGRDIAVDDAGAAYVTGETLSADFPTATGTYDTTQNPGRDVFVTKFSVAGNTLVYSTYLGGGDLGFGSHDSGHGIAVDGDGAAYVTGETESSDFPTTPGAYDTIFNEPVGGGSDAFVTKISAEGDALVYSTYLGGRGGDYGWGITVDGAGSAYVTGRPSSPFPTTPGAYDRTRNDAFDLL